MTITGTFFGLSIGALLSGLLSDKYGRKPTGLYGMFFVFIFILGTALSNNIIQFVILRFLLGVSIGISHPMTDCYIMETFSIWYRAKVVGFYKIFYIIGEFTTAIFALFTLESLEEGNWRLLLVFMAIIALFTWIYLLIFFDESCRFLFFIGDEKQAFSVLEKIPWSKKRKFKIG